MDENVVIDDDNKLAETFNNVFSNAVKKLNIQINEDVISDTCELDQVLRTINKYKLHRSITKLHQINGDNEVFFAMVDIFMKLLY